jgi:hypothetical protein
MTENELAEATNRLGRSEEKFLATVTTMIESMQMMTDVMKDNRDHFQKQLHAFDSTEELMRKQIEVLREITAGMEAIVKGCGQNNLTLSENTERMKALLTKVESYFGDSAGLEFEN